MKILWAKSDFLHPTTKGGHIRTLEMLRRMRRNHEIHYVAFAGPHLAESLEHSAEYCAKAYPIEHPIPVHASPAFAWQLVQGLMSPLPVAVARYRSKAMREQLARLIEQERFDSVVSDFIFPTPNFPDLRECIVFQHNVETMIWRRHAETAANPLRRLYFREQARKMYDYERSVCRSARHVIGVSVVDAELMQSMFGIEDISHVATGVDIGYFAPQPVEAQTDLVFVGSMDWLPNIDGIRYFTESILPLIRRSRPDCSVAVVGRNPSREIQALAEQDGQMVVTGTVPDIRKYLWGGLVSIVPLRIGGGTRLKIYESMAARTAVISTTVGAEGLEINPPRDIRIADTPETFAAGCLELLESESLRQSQAEAAWTMVASRFSWEKIARHFEEILEAHAAAPTSAARQRS